MRRIGKTIHGIDMDATGKRIAKFIDNSGLTDKVLSNIMDLSVQSINKWRHGYCLPDMENIFILCQILGIGVEDVLVPRKEAACGFEDNVTFSFKRRIRSYCNAIN